MAWQYWHPRSWKSAAPREACGETWPITFAGSGRAEKSGDQSAREPATQKPSTIVTIPTTIATAQGRLLGARSPRFETNGTEMRTSPARSGASTITQVSAPFGRSASTA
jgi:hypothetical protein